MSEKVFLCFAIRDNSEGVISDDDWAHAVEIVEKYRGVALDDLPKSLRSIPHPAEEIE